MTFVPLSLTSNFMCHSYIVKIILCIDKILIYIYDHKIGFKNYCNYCIFYFINRKYSSLFDIGTNIYRAIYEEDFLTYFPFIILNTVLMYKNYSKQK